MNNDWEILDIADFDAANSVSDILLRNNANGKVNVWLMKTDGSGIDSYATVATLSSDWEILRTTKFNADSKADILLRNWANGKINVWLMNGAAISNYYTIATLNNDWEILE